MNKRQGSGIIIYNPELDAFVIQLRDIPPFGWAILGGYVKKNETPDQAAERELKEELQNIVFDRQNLQYFKSYDERPDGFVQHIYEYLTSQRFEPYEGLPVLVCGEGADMNLVTRTQILQARLKSERDILDNLYDSIPNHLKNSKVMRAFTRYLVKRIYTPEPLTLLWNCKKIFNDYFVKEH